MGAARVVGGTARPQQVVGGWREWAVEFGWVAVCLWAGVLTGVGVLLHLAS